jgi:antitoxin component YwqK of YwqJK toxin-antitoxin module
VFCNKISAVIVQDHIHPYDLCSIITYYLKLMSKREEITMKTFLASMLIFASVMLSSRGHNKHRDYSMGKDGLIYKYGSHRLYTGVIKDTLDLIIQYSVIWGKKNGEYITHYPNGKLERLGFLVNNLNEGEWKYYYPNGILESKGEYDKSEANGKWTYFYSNGTIMTEGYYMNSTKEGKWIFYNRDGSIEGIKYFRNGELLKAEDKFRIS